jgi:hypothetical protein
VFPLLSAVRGRLMNPREVVSVQLARSGQATAVTQHPGRSGHSARERSPKIRPPWIWLLCLVAGPVSGQRVDVDGSVEAEDVSSEVGDDGRADGLSGDYRVLAVRGGDGSFSDSGGPVAAPAFEPCC